MREEAKGSKRDKEVLQLEREELKAELALMQAQVRRLEGTGSVEDRCGGRDCALILLCVPACVCS